MIIVVNLICKIYKLKETTMTFIALVFVIALAIYYQRRAEHSYESLRRNLGDSHTDENIHNNWHVEKIRNEAIKLPYASLQIRIVLNILLITPTARAYLIELFKSMSETSTVGVPHGIGYLL